MPPHEPCKICFKTEAYECTFTCQHISLVQSTFGGFGLINQENVFKVCDQPHPLLVGSIIGNCLKLKIDDAYDGMRVSRYAKCIVSH